MRLFQIFTEEIGIRRDFRSGGRRSFRNLGSLMLFLISMAASTHAQSLEDYLAIALKNNPEIASKYNAYQAALEKAPQVSTLPDPQLTVGYFVSPVETRVGPQQVRFSISQPIPWFGTLEAQKQVALAEAQAQLAAYESARNNVAWEVKQQWYQLYERDQIIQINRENIAILHSLEKLALTQYEAGTASMVDVLRAQMQITQAENDLSLLQDQQSAQMIRFNLLLNRAPKLPVHVPDTLTVSQRNPTTLSSNTPDTLFSQNPVLQQLTHQTMALEKKRKVAQLSGKPRLGVGLDYAVVNPRSDMEMSDNGKDIIMPMVSVSLPIFRKKYTAAQQETMLSYTSMQLQTEALVNDLSSRLEEAYQQSRDAARRIELYRQQIQKARQAFNILTTAFSTGDNDFEEVLQMQQQILNYRLALVKAVKDWYLAEARKDYLTFSNQE